MTDREPIDVQPLGDATAATPWEKVRQQLAESDYYWLVPRRPDNRPHTRPLLAVLMANSLCFCAGSTARKSKNLVVDSHCSIATETDHLHFVVEDVAIKVSDERTLEDVADAYRRNTSGKSMFVTAHFTQTVRQPQDHLHTKSTK